MSLIDMDKKIARVDGKSIVNNKSKKRVFFELTFREIKHIRRCALLYLRIHPELNDSELDKNLSHKIYGKFERFGRGDRRISSKILKERLKDIPIVCSWNNCEEKINLEIDHIRPLSADGSNKKDNLRFLCKKHHRIREINYILKRKKLEVKKLEEEKNKLETGNAKNN